MSERKYRMVPAVQAGYGGPAADNRFVVQYQDQGMPWFDIGGPLPKPEAQARMDEKRGSA